MNRQKELLTNTIIIGIGNVFSKAISFLLVPFFTVWLTTEEYGDFDLLFSYISLVVPFITMQLEQAVLRFTLEKKESAGEYFKSSFVLVLINLFLAISFICFVLRFQYQFSFTFCVISYSIYIFLSEYLRGLNELTKYSFVNILLGFLTIISSYFFTNVLKLAVDGLLIAFGFCYLLISIGIVVSQNLLSEFFTTPFNKITTRQLLLYAIPLLPNAISWWITSVSDRTLIRIFLGSDQNGIYAVSTKIPTLIAVFYSIFNLAWQQTAIISSKDQVDIRNKFYQSTYEKLFTFLFTSGIGIIVITPLLYKFLLGEEYGNGINLVPILILGTVFLNLSQYLGGILIGKMNTKVNGVSTLIAAGINILLNLLFINLFGLIAAAMSTLICYIVLFILRIVNLKEIFNLKKVITESTVGAIIFLFLSHVILSQDNIFVQITYVVIYLFFYIFINKKMIFGIVNLMKRKAK
ncbi:MULTISPECIES: lipopolysaccharide biosynthesis protein [Streptococcus]|uniref:lipopolysaccharide biosynthesis protein n=1 Tax=Streptococcus TaxID=1301 RepID=UPI001EE79265|nr:oligosaccharide flippase family protein [Streptococcus suis]MBS8055620.1 oligosaccharide flippase family protein [Streptococcus suis]HEL2570399.1 oligosaccharide flippase family protein [Streptococcus suis]